MPIDRPDEYEHPDSGQDFPTIPGLDRHRLTDKMRVHIDKVIISEAESKIIGEYFPGASVEEARALIYTLRAVEPPWMHSVLGQFPPLAETPYRFYGPWSVFLDINRFGDISAILRGRPEDRDRFLAAVYESFDELFLTYGYRLQKEPGGDSLFAVCQTPGDDRTFALGAAHIIRSIPSVLAGVEERLPDIMDTLRADGVDRLTASSAILNEWILGADFVLGDDQAVRVYNMRSLLNLQKTAGRGKCKTTTGVLKALNIPGVRYNTTLDSDNPSIDFADIPPYPNPPLDRRRSGIELLRQLIDQGHEPLKIATHVGAYLRPATRATMATDTIQTSEVRSVAAIHLPTFMEELGRDESSLPDFMSSVSVILDTAASNDARVSLMTIDEDKLFFEGTDLRALFRVCCAIRQAAESHRLPCRIGIAEGAMRRGPLAGIAPRCDLEQSDALVKAVRLATSPQPGSDLLLTAALGTDPRLRDMATVSKRMVGVHAKEGLLEGATVIDVHLNRPKPAPTLLERDSVRERLFHHQCTLVSGGRGMGKSEFLRQCDLKVSLVGKNIEADLWRHFGSPLTAYSRNALIDALRARGSDGRLVIGIDDLHEFDPAALYFLSYLIKRLEDENIAHVFIVGTYNPDARPEFSHTLISAGFQNVLSLQPLSPAAVQRMIDIETRHFQLPTDAVTALHKLGGVPQLVLDALPYYRHAAEQQETPDTAAIMLDYLHSLVPNRADFDLMARCSIFPQDFDVDAVSGLYDEIDRSNVEAGLRRLCEGGILELSGAGRYRFRVEPLRLTVYDSVPAERRRWHRMISKRDINDPLSYLYHINRFLTLSDYYQGDELSNLVRAAAQQAEWLYKRHDYHGILRFARPTFANLQRHGEQHEFGEADLPNIFRLFELTREVLVRVNEPSEAFGIASDHFVRAEHLPHEERYRLLLKLFRIARMAPKHFGEFSNILDAFHAEHPVPNICLLRDSLRDRMNPAINPSEILAEKRYNIDPFNTSMPAPEALAFARNRIFLLVRARRFDDAVAEASALVPVMQSHREELDPADQINTLYDLLYAAYQHREQHPDSSGSATLRELEPHIREIIRLAECHHVPHRKAQGMTMLVEFRDFDLRFTDRDFRVSDAYLPADLTGRCLEILEQRFSDAGIPFDTERRSVLSRYIADQRHLYLQHYCLGNAQFLPHHRERIEAHNVEKKATAQWIMQRFSPESDMYIEASLLLAEALFVEGGDDNMRRAGELMLHILQFCRDRFDRPTTFYRKTYDKMSVLWAYFTARHTSAGES